MEVSDNTDAILSDDYEEGEILDEDTLYDNVSSLEEFSGSDSELKLHGEVSSPVVKKTISSGHKEKHHRRKEHKCKEDSICRKERSGKHCYARIRRGKTVEDTEKGKSADFVVTHVHDLHNSKKKSHVILSPIHDTLPKYNSRRLSVQKDLHEKENRINHKHSRYYDSHKSLPHRIDKKKVSDKAKKYFILGNSRSHERKRSRSPSPKLPVRSQIKELAASRGKTSLLKRLVGSGSIGVKTPKDIEEPKKTSSSGDNANDEPSKDVGVEECQILIIEDEEENQKSDIIKHQDSDESLRLEVNGEEAIQKNLDHVENSVDTTTIDCQRTEIESNQNCKIVESKEIKQDPISMIHNIALVPSEKSMHCQPESKEVNAEISEISKLVVEHVTQEVVNQSENNIVANTSHGNSSQTEGTHKNEQKIPEDTDELHLRLEALRTAMLRKHKERKKRGFICRKKSTLEDDSFAEYVLSHIDKDNSLIIKDEDHNEIGQTDCNGVNMLGDLLNPEDMVIDKNDKGEDVENNILENFPYPPNYPLQNSDMPIHYVGFPGSYSVYPYPVINGNIPFPPLKENTDLVPDADRNLPHDFPSYPLPSSQIIVSPLEPDTSQIPLPEDGVSFPRTDFDQTVKDHSNETDCMENCLREINSNKELIERNKRVRKLSSRYKLCRRRELNGKKWHTSRAVIKRKLERREYAEQKRKRKESIRDLKIIRTERAISKELNEEESDEETALRELALKSVKEREKPKNLLESASIQEKDKSNHNDNSINMNEDQILTDLQIDVDTNLNSKPLISYDSESTPTNLSSEPWDDIDEDILRAQLLSSLSSRIPEKHTENATTYGPKYTKKQVRKALLRAERKCFDARSDKKLKLISLKVNKENFKRIAKIKSNDIAKRKMDCLLQNMNNFKKNPIKISQSVGQSSTDVPIVPKFIISLKEDSSSEDETIHQVQAEQPDVVKSIDLFLQEARIENDLKQGLLGQDEKEGNSTKPDEIKHPAIEEIKVQDKSEKTSTGGGSTPQVLKHLPAWQQEEYRRLKKQIAEKEKVLKAAKERVLLPNESEETLKEANLSKNLKSKNQLNNEENNSCSKNIEEIDNSCGENVSESIKTIENDVSPANNSEGLANNNKKSVIAQQSNATQSSATLNDSTKIVDDVNHLAKIVAQLETGMGDYRTLKEDIERKKKEILIAKLNMAKQKKMLFEIKKKIITEEKIIQTKLEQDILQPDVTKNDPSDKKKPASRDLELCKLRMREFSLRTKMIFDEIDHSSGLNKTMKINPKAGVMPVDKTKTALQTVPNCRRIDKAPNKITRQPKLLPSIEKSKRNNNNNEQRNNVTNGSLSVSEKQSENWDPFVPICPFDLSGVCKDEECKFQHIKAA